MKDKKISLEINVIITGEYRSAALSIYNLKYSLPKKILTAFDNESNYDFQFIIKEMVEEFKKCFLCEIVLIKIEKKLQNIILQATIY